MGAVTDGHRPTSAHTQTLRTLLLTGILPHNYAYNQACVVGTVTDTNKLTYAHNQTNDMGPVADGHKLT